MALYLDARRSRVLAILGSTFILIGLTSIIISSVFGTFSFSLILPAILLGIGVVMISLVIYSNCRKVDYQSNVNQNAVSLTSGYQSTTQPGSYGHQQEPPQGLPLQPVYPPGGPAAQPYPPMAQQPYYPQQSSYSPGLPPQAYPPQTYPPQAYPPQGTSYPIGQPHTQSTPYQPNESTPDDPPPAYSDLKQ